MSGTTLYRVSPENGVWKIELAGDSVTEWSTNKSEAIERARVLARRAPHGAVIVVDREGRVETEIEVDAVKGSS